MNLKLIIIAIISELMLISCHGKSSSIVNSGEKNAGANPVSSTENIVETSVTNNAGEVLILKFDNEAQTCTFGFKGDTALLKQERMGSGIKYSDEHFTYTEWHGEIGLYKDSVLIFSNDRQ